MFYYEYNYLNVQLNSTKIYIIGRYADVEIGEKQNFRKDNMFSSSHRDIKDKARNAEIAEPKATATEKLVGKVWMKYVFLKANCLINDYSFSNDLK